MFEAVHLKYLLVYSDNNYETINLISFYIIFIDRAIEL